MVTSRRRLLAASAVVVVPSAGCFTVGVGEGSVDVEVTNFDAVAYETTIAVSGDFSEQEVTRTVEAGETVVFEELVPRLDYDHEFRVELRLDGTTALEERYRMDHDRDVYAFRITEDGTVESDDSGP